MEALSLHQRLEPSASCCDGTSMKSSSVLVLSIKAEHFVTNEKNKNPLRKEDVDWSQLRVILTPAVLHIREMPSNSKNCQ
jgi:hypothetical protein